MRRKMAALAAVLALGLGLSACKKKPHKPSPQATGQAQTIQAFGQLSAAVPYPAGQLTDSIERRNLKERLLRLNKAEKIGYLYLLSDTGSVVAFYTIKGKVSSTDSQMTTSQLIVHCGPRTDSGWCTAPAPGDDGSYGANEPGIFAFTTENVMIQWNGKYLYADAPLKVTSAPLVVLPADAKPTSTGDGK